LHDYISEISEHADVRAGSPLPLGIQESGGGVNFAIFSRYATRVQLELFDHPEDAAPAQLEFNAGDHRHFDHGYAVTSHSSQGLTAERVLVHADTGVHPDLLNCRFGYVSISRASHEATLFTDDMAELAPQLGADVSKTSALEISQASSVAHGIGIGQSAHCATPANQEVSIQ
jgi:ATP-dependent exoDNAse (exonuclease V) alpha subunit